MKEMWNERYADKEYAYGIKPNEFLKETLDTYNLKGKILFPAEGEGRNAVYAAKKGLEIFAFDISIEGKNKALKLAEKENVKINYEVGDFFSLNLLNEKFDIASLIFAHFPPNILSEYHSKIAALIKPNGIIILEGFSKNHFELQKENPNAGGPKNIDFLFSIDMIKNDFPNFKIILLEEKEIELEEGLFHKAKSNVIRFIGRKTNIPNL
ncbi:class I SAM-dependent methyltransferase [Polaribacter sp. Z014]|uniref:class I SAM-dependent methyltransferase n=1 Tax=unclassified Polaribacter TaxID=196858 RepID=UPI00193AF049|nr:MULTISPECIES: class I SAM-dependent methyltransferase [unclassified Polaribacter]MCL7763132.1 class I SAM-dependent methyltransferase [Polaribacter sp. Z014]QVY65446.1 class I SAM-dependent methyltransferase [Polaribacter sp. Q13]